MDYIDNLLQQAARFELEGNLELAQRLLERAAALEVEMTSKSSGISFRLERNGNLVSL